MHTPRNWRTMYRELVSNPFFPTLFISEAVKITVQAGPDFKMIGLAIIATVMWIMSDNVEEAVENITDE